MLICNCDWACLCQTTLLVVWLCLGFMRRLLQELPRDLMSLLLLAACTMGVGTYGLNLTNQFHSGYLTTFDLLTLFCLKHV